jgi:hypothetical protein
MNTSLLPTSAEIPKPTAPPSLADDYDAETADAHHDFAGYLDSLDWGPGDTKHLQQYQSFLRAASLGIDTKVAYTMVLHRIEDAGGQVLPYQMERQLQRAYQHVAQHEIPGAVTLRDSAPKPKFSPEALQRVVAATADVSDIVKFIKARSPIWPDAITSEALLQILYPPGEKVVIFTDSRSQGQYVHGDSHEKGELPQGSRDGVWFLTNPVDGRYHPNPREDYKLSRRSEESITAWRYLLIESDVAAPLDWMRVMVQFPLRIVAVYTSGGKSIHSLVRVDAESKSAWDAIKNQIKPLLVTLGADPGALKAVQLSRLPQCWRGERKQELLFLNPLADGTPILKMAEQKGGQHHA